MYIPVLEFIPLFSCFLGASSAFSASQRLKNVRLIFTAEKEKAQRNERNLL